jgi:alanine racemase
MALSALLADDPTAASLTIDLPALQSNYRLIAERVAPAKASANIKANAYGLGIDLVVPALVDAGCSHFFVATISEGLSARASAPHATIYVLNSFSFNAAKIYEAHRLSAVLGSLEDITDFEKAVNDGVKLSPPALHIDTGMNRLGLTIDEARSYAEHRKCETSPFVFSLLMTHFIESEMQGSSITEKQVALFEEMRALFPNVPASLSNSSGVFLDKKTAYDLVRPGYALYGGNPRLDQTNPMKPVIRLEAPILQIRFAKKGTPIGYGGEITVQRDTNIATLSIGYGDGYPRGAKNTDTKTGAECLIAGHRCKILGRISMDLVMADITDCPEGAVKRGDLAVMIGDDITLDEVAAKSGTIGYEILVHLGPRFRRRVLTGKD